MITDWPSLTSLSLVDLIAAVILGGLLVFVVLHASQGRVVDVIGDIFAAAFLGFALADFHESARWAVATAVVMAGAAFSLLAYAVHYVRARTGRES